MMSAAAACLGACLAIAWAAGEDLNLKFQRQTVTNLLLRRSCRDNTIGSVSGCFVAFDPVACIQPRKGLLYRPLVPSLTSTTIPGPTTIPADFQTTIATETSAARPIQSP